jgi:hypothetical protein
VRRVARGFKGLLQVELRGSVAADPLRDVKTRRGHVGADSLVLSPRHGRSVARGKASMSGGWAGLWGGWGGGGGGIATRGRA